MLIEKQEKYYTYLLCVFIGSLTIASVLASKIISVFGLFVPAGILAYSITFICSDVISEIWGKERARSTVTGGFFALVATFLLVQVALVWPGAPFWQGDDSFKAILGSTSRIIIASFIAYLVSQFHDVWAFHFWKRITKGRHLWLRNNLSTAVSQFLDSVVFVTIAFYGVMPIWQLILGQWIVKFFIGVLDTPIIYAVIWYLRKGAKFEQNKECLNVN